MTSAFDLYALYNKTICYPMVTANSCYKLYTYVTQRLSST